MKIAFCGGHPGLDPGSTTPALLERACSHGLRLKAAMTTGKKPHD